MKILIINQHGENRGDESALAGLIYGLEKNLKKRIKFTVLGQFKDQEYKIKILNRHVNTINIVFSPFQYILLMLYAVLFDFFKIRFNALLTKNLKNIIQEYSGSDLVVSAPGGGYIGDIYKNHEFIHWLYIYLGKLHQKKMMLYSPSVGPFKAQIFNYFRKKIFRMFNTITLRESQSLKYLKKLDDQINATLSADASLSLKATPINNIKKKVDGKFIVSIVASDFKYKTNYLENKTRYIKNLIEIITFLKTKKNVHCIFLPQLVGNAHNDYYFQKSIARMLPANISWEILDQKFDSTYQKRVFASSDFAISSRYHPGIFATSAAVPGIFFAYEHKQIGYFKDLKYPFVYDINNIKINKVINDIDLILKNYNKIKNELKQNIKPLIKKAQISSKIAKNLILNN